MAIDYAAAKRMCIKHKGALTRAKKKGPYAVMNAVTAFYEDFHTHDLPLPDNWHLWDVAERDAMHSIRRVEHLGD